MLWRSTGTVWALLIPLIGLGSLIGFVIASRLQHKRMSAVYLGLLILGHIVLVLILLWSLQAPLARGS